MSPPAARHRPKPQSQRSQGREAGNVLKQRLAEHQKSNETAVASANPFLSSFSLNLMNTMREEIDKNGKPVSSATEPIEVSILAEIAYIHICHESLPFHGAAAGFMRHHSAAIGATTPRVPPVTKEKYSCRQGAPWLLEPAFRQPEITVNRNRSQSGK